MALHSKNHFPKSYDKMKKEPDLSDLSPPKNFRKFWWKLTKCLVFKLYNLIILNSWYDIPSFFHLTTTNTESARCDHLVWLHGVKQKMERTTIKVNLIKSCGGLFFEKGRGIWIWTWNRVGCFEFELILDYIDRLFEFESNWRVFKIFL